MERRFDLFYELQESLHIRAIDKGNLMNKKKKTELLIQFWIVFMAFIWKRTKLEYGLLY